VNIAQHVERAARFFPGHPAILFEGTTIGYADLNAGVNRLASALMAHGVKAGDRVALYLPNAPEFPLCYLAALKSGAVVVSINGSLKADEIKYILTIRARGCCLPWAISSPIFPAGNVQRWRT